MVMSTLKFYPRIHFPFFNNSPYIVIGGTTDNYISENRVASIDYENQLKSARNLEINKCA